MPKAGFQGVGRAESSPMLSARPPPRCWRQLCDSPTSRATAGPRVEFGRLAFRSAAGSLAQITKFNHQQTRHCAAWRKAALPGFDSRVRCCSGGAMPTTWGTLGPGHARGSPLSASGLELIQREFRQFPWLEQGGAPGPGSTICAWAKGPCCWAANPGRTAIPGPPHRRLQAGG